MWDVRSLSAARRMLQQDPLVLALGFFDGVHRGHQRVLRTALRHARALPAAAGVMTFDPHPLSVIRPEKAPALLMTTEQKLASLAVLGLDGCLLLRFDRRLRDLSAAAFLDRLGRALPTLCHIVVGRNWRVGSDQVAAAAGLASLTAERGLGLTLVAPVMLDGRAISSTRVRTAITAGQMEAVHRMLGQPFSFEGRVVSGRKIGRTLGFPTANLDPATVLLPPPGVYAGSARIAGRWRAAALCLGGRPTFLPQPSPPVLEVHVLDCKGLNLYRRRLAVRFLKRLRANRAYASPQALVRRIERDIGAVRRLLRVTGGKPRQNAR